MRSDVVFATNKRTGIVRPVLALWVHLPPVAKIASAVITLGVTTRAVLAACSSVHHAIATFLGGWVVGQFLAAGVDASLVAEEEA